MHVTYPASTETVAASDFPVGGNSASVKFTSKWASQPQIVTMGGRKADGTFTGATWAYDGSSWARISESMPAAEGYAVTQYQICGSGRYIVRRRRYIIVRPCPVAGTQA